MESDQGRVGVSLITIEDTGEPEPTNLVLSSVLEVGHLSSASGRGFGVFGDSDGLAARTSLR